MPKRKPLKKQPPSTRERLLALSSGLLSDALGKTGAMHHDMQCRSANCRLAGAAFTVRVHPADILMVGKAVSTCPPGQVLVIDGHGELNTALWGGIITVAARRKGLAGVVIDGAIRDRAEISRDSFPVFARAVVPNAGGAEYAGEMDIPVPCGGVVVTPGDWLVGDQDGVTVVPAPRLDDALAKAERLLEVEEKIQAQVEQGKDLAEILRYEETLQRKAREGLLPQLRFQGK